jgi:hypothetical protein
MDQYDKNVELFAQLVSAKMKQDKHIQIANRKPFNWRKLVGRVLGFLVLVAIAWGFAQAWTAW